MKKDNQTNEQTTLSGNYEALGVDYLLVFCVRNVLENSEECTLERLVFECFTLFPKKFSLSRYPQWPDSTRVYRSWRRGIDNKWLKGTPQEGFALTTKGKALALEIAAKLKDPSVVAKHPRQATRARGKEEAVTRYLRKSETFRKWSENPTLFIITESELRSLLNATLETSDMALGENLEYYIENAGLVQDSDVLAFLNTCKKQHPQILGR